MMRNHFSATKKGVMGLLLAGLLAVLLLEMLPGASVPRLAAQMLTSHASVPETPENSTYAQLQSWAQDLAAQDEDLTRREIALGVEKRVQQQTILLYLLGGFMALVLVNFAFDYFERKELHRVENQLRAMGAKP
jgi:hypothetical protein